MTGPQLICWLFLITLPVSTFVWSFLLVYRWHYFRRYLLSHAVILLVYPVLIHYLYRGEQDEFSGPFLTAFVGYSHCLLGTAAAFFIRKKYLRYV